MSNYDFFTCLGLYNIKGMVLKWLIWVMLVSVWYCHDLSSFCHHNIQFLSWIFSGIYLLGRRNMVLKESKGRMLASAPSSTLTLMLSMPFQCGSLMLRIVRILVLPSGSISLLMLATDFNLEILWNVFLIKSLLSKGCFLWRSGWSWKEFCSMLWALWVVDLLLDLSSKSSVANLLCLLLLLLLLSDSMGWSVLVSV